MRGLLLICAAVILCSGCVRVAAYERGCLSEMTMRPVGTRFRHTVSGLPAHYFPKMKSTLRTSYRFYADNFDVRAHTLLGDLARFWSHEWGAKVLFHLTEPGRAHQHHLDVYYNRYTRTNNLSVNVVSMGYGYNF